MRLQILVQPFFFHRSLLAAADFGAFAIEHDDVPRSKFVAVITFGWIAGRRAEIIEVGRGASGMELVVADGGARPPLLPAPGGIVALRELLGGAALVCVVARRKNRTGNAVEKLGSRLGAGKVRAVGDVTSAHQHDIRIALFLRRGGLRADARNKSNAEQ